MTGSGFEDITPWPGGEWGKAYLDLFVGGELNIQKLAGAWFEWRYVKFFLKADIAKIGVVEVKCVFWLVDWT